jgi:hypothetical protein
VYWPTGRHNGQLGSAGAVRGSEPPSRQAAWPPSWLPMVPMIPKLKAFALHLAVSILGAAALIGIFIWFWFPMPYFLADGGWQALRLVVAIDLVLGPVLTLVVYNPRKPKREFLFDYTVIGLLQVAALSFGIWTSSMHRTAMVVFADGTFYTLDAETVGQIGTAATALARNTRLRPAYAVVRMPEDPAARQKIRQEALAARRPLYTRGDLLAPLDAQTAALVHEQPLDLHRALGGRPEQKRKIADFQAKHGAESSSCSFVPLVCRYGNLLAAVDSTGRVVGTLPIHLSAQEALHRKKKTASSAVAGLNG